MKTGKSLVELAQEIQRQSESKQDYLAPASKLHAVVETVDQKPLVAIELQGQATLPLTPYAHGQMAQYLEIPKAYYDRMLACAPNLLADSVNRWLSDHQDRRMIRTLDGHVRAVLSDRYRPLDYDDLAEAILPVLKDLNVMVLSAEITERRFYIKAVDNSIQRDVPTGAVMGDGKHNIFDSVNPAIVISDSEIGAGSLSIETSVFTRACTNLSVFGASLKKYHTGARAELSDEVYALLTDRTRSATDRALWMQTRDLVRAAFDEAKFAALVQKLGQAAEERIEDSPVEVVERVTKRFSWTQGERDSVLTHLVRGGDLTKYGLHAAVTRAAEDLDDYDRASEFERLGGNIIDLSPKDWKEIAQAA